MRISYYVYIALSLFRSHVSGKFKHVMDMNSTLLISQQESEARAQRDREFVSQQRRDYDQALQESREAVETARLEQQQFATRAEQFVRAQQEQHEEQLRIQEDRHRSQQQRRSDSSGNGQVLYINEMAYRECWDDGKANSGLRCTLGSRTTLKTMSTPLVCVFQAGGHRVRCLRFTHFGSCLAYSSRVGFSLLPAGPLPSDCAYSCQRFFFARHLSDVGRC